VSCAKAIWHRIQVDILPGYESGVLFVDVQVFGVGCQKSSRCLHFCCAIEISEEFFIWCHPIDSLVRFGSIVEIDESQQAIIPTYNLSLPAIHKYLLCMPHIPHGLNYPFSLTLVWGDSALKYLCL